MARKKPYPEAITARNRHPELTRTDDYLYAARYFIAASVAVVSAVMSYQALAHLNARGDIAEQWRWVWPVIVDGPHLAGALAVVVAQRRREPAAWSWFLLLGSTAASVAANVAAAPPDTLSRVLHGVVPVVGFIQIKDLCIGIRKRLDATAAAEAPAAPAEVPAAPEPLPAPEPVVIYAPVVEPAFPVPPKPTTAPEPAPLPQPPPEPARTSGPRPVPAASDPGTKTGSSTAFDRHINQALVWLATDPELSGSEIGRKLGKSDRYGRSVRNAALTLVDTSAAG